MALDVLIVDESAAVRQILHRVLLQTDLRLGRVHEAKDGQEGLERIRTETVGLILSDIDMPNMDSLEFLKALKANPAWQAIPVMMVTIDGNQDKVLQALKLGAAGYVRKPSTPDPIKIPQSRAGDAGHFNPVLLGGDVGPPGGVGCASRTAHFDR